MITSSLQILHHYIIITDSPSLHHHYRFSIITSSLQILHHYIITSSLQILLQYGASPNYRDAKGLTPVYHTAIMGDDTGACVFLLRHRAEMGVRDPGGWTELHQVRVCTCTCVGMCVCICASASVCVCMCL